MEDHKESEQVPEEESPKSKTTIYMATPVKNDSVAECPHCHEKINVTRKMSIVQCDYCSEYMHIVFVSKSEAEQ